MILEQPEAPADAPRGEPRPERTLAWVISAKSESALRAQARRLAQFASAHRELDCADIGASLNTTRTSFAHRAVIVARAREDFGRGLAALADGNPATNLVTGTGRGSGKLAFLFTGQGSQRPGMGRELHEAYPAFAKSFDEACDALDPHLQRPLRDVVFCDSGGAALLDQTGYTQPALFALETSLCRLVLSCGLTPDFLIGHSVGELVAAHVAGVFSLTDAAAMVAARARLMQDLPADGAMIAVEATEDQIREAVEDHRDLVSIAAVNAPNSVIISGDENVVAEIAARLAAEGRRTKRLTVSHAFHSPRVEPMLAEFESFADQFKYASPQRILVCNRTGATLGRM